MVRCVTPSPGNMLTCSFSLFLKRPHSTGAAHSTAAETTNLMKRMVAAGVGTRLEEAEC